MRKCQKNSFGPDFGPSGTGVRAILRKTCNLRNFAFYNLSENVDLQSYEEGWITLQLRLGLSSEKFVICKILHFTATARTLVFNPCKKIGQL